MKTLGFQTFLIYTEAKTRGIISIIKIILYDFRILKKLYLLLLTIKPIYMKILFSIALFCTLTAFTAGNEVKEDADITSYKAVYSGGPDAYFKTKACRAAFIAGPHPEYTVVPGTFLWPEAQVIVCN
ncbi:MAG: hypothetical protein PSV16_06470 [Flavobacterium sp.]|nr:hypothetical protein [Flavobacterium sp.]